MFGSMNISLHILNCSYGHVDAEFRENMTKEEAQQFVRKAISHAMARDGSSGGVIRMVVIDKTGVSIEYLIVVVH